MENQEKKENRGGFREGAGRKSKGTEARRTTMAISGTASEIETIKKMAAEAGKSASRFLIEMAMGGGNKWKLPNPCTSYI